ncbi:hypothetical protein [Methylobacter tundripaludum]|uniref:hypothetical protein n=1 Tax=Methylobacter tundripaludum TaxID=173365 RepID=UPI000CEA9B6D|nr:hypothetical protein [Methylobacter tundripaludum]
MFFISILWRTAITNSETFAQVKLGSWENKLKTMILTEDPGCKNNFSILIYKYEGEFSEIMINPTKHRGETEQVDYGVNFYILSFPNYRFIIKVDQRNFSSRLDTLILSPDQPLLIPVSDFKSSVEYEKLIANWVPHDKRCKADDL